MEADFDIGRTAGNKDRISLRVLLGGILGMVVAMGIGRFAFTPILPLMQRDLGVSNSLAGELAGLNYLGYLGGALLCSLAPRLLRSRWLAGGSLLASLVTTLGMGLTRSPFGWGALRLVGGVASAVLFIVIAAEVSETLARRGQGHWLGALYGGIGLGIAFSGLAVPWLDGIGDWETAWIGIGIFAIPLGFIGAFLGRSAAPVRPAAGAVPAPVGGLHRIRLLAAAYFLEGLGYIVTATFLVAIVARTPGLAGFASYSWVAVGLAAIPSTIFWPRLARRIGQRPALLAAYAVQAAGILVSRQAGSLFAVLFAAISFGGTFLGIVALTLGEGNRRLGPDGGRRVAAVLTTAFSLGQMLGPVIAGRLADLQAGFALPLLLAAACVILAEICTLFDRYFQPHKQGVSLCPTSISASPKKVPPPNRRPG